MQEDLENRTVTLIISASKLTERTLQTAVNKYLNHLRARKLNKAKPVGKQTVKQLIGQNQGVSSIEITGKNIKSFDRVARKYGVDYAVKKDRSGKTPKYLVFFKARDADALSSAFTEYAKRMEKSKKKSSVVQKLKEQEVPEAARDVSKVRNKEKDLER